MDIVGVRGIGSRMEFMVVAKGRIQEACLK